jgi:hexulose-6-phosphate isomerase
MNIKKIGFMQGRLVESINNQIQCFPKSSWIQEFKIAEKVGFELMEWIFDDYDNPILTDKNKISLLCKEHKIKINSVCADFFMNHKLFSEPETELNKNLDILKNLISSAHDLGIQIIEIPLIDVSSIKNSSSNEEQFRFNLQKAIPIAEKNNVILNLETDLTANDFRALLLNFSSDIVKANYDIGNITHLNYDVNNELIILHDLISNIHIKDRLIGGPSVPLGTGDVDFESFFSTLSQINYTGDFIIQGARGNEHYVSPAETCVKYRDFVNHYLYKYFK